MSVRSSIKRIAYTSGTLTRRHRKRNRDNLTIAMFHRVLADDDPRRAGADPEWTLSDALFRDCLAFFAEHYSVLSPAELETFARGGSELPECPLLLTFDDGWADNAETALPILAEANMSGFVFVVSSAIGSLQAFWQEQLFSAWKRRLLTESQCAALWFEAGGTASDESGEWRRPSGIRRLISRLERLAPAERDRVLRTNSAKLDEDTPAQMVSADQVRELHSAGMRIGSHGATHTPLTKVDDLGGELRDSREALEYLLGEDAKSLSFPHGAHDAAVQEASRSAGYELLFTSEECLNDVSSGKLPQLLGRINIPAHEITSSTGDFAPERLATWLFSRKAQ